MDSYSDINRTRNYFLTMATLEANKLSSTANFVSSIHLEDSLLRINFREDVKRFIDNQLTMIRNAASDELCQACIQNLKEGHEYLTVQHRMLRSGEAAIYASVSFYREHDKLIGYIIDGVGLVPGGLQIIAGAGLIGASLGAGNIIGTIVGANLILNGINNAQENFFKITDGTETPVFMRTAYIDTAVFLGFDKKLGNLSYQSVVLTTSY